MDSPSRQAGKQAGSQAYLLASRTDAIWIIAENNRSRLIILFKTMPCYAVIINASNNNTNWVKFNRY